MKQLIVLDKNTGERLEDFEFSGGYNISFVNNHDSGEQKHIRRLDNGKYGDNHWIKNNIYRSITIKLKEKFEELKHIKPHRILFIEDMNWSKTASQKNPWKARIKKVSKDLEATTGYWYVLETRSYFVENMSDEQLVALLYSTLRQIDMDGDIIEPNIVGWSNIIATLGAGWDDENSFIDNILGDDFDNWNELPKGGKQINMFDKFIPMRIAK